MEERSQPRESEIILYTTSNGVAKVEVYFRDESFWLSQRRMAELFDVEVSTINYHLKEIYQSGELQEGATIRKFRIVQDEGERSVARGVDFYHLDAIIAVGYRVNSLRATQFRIWATPAEIITNRVNANCKNIGLTGQCSTDFQDRGVPSLRWCEEGRMKIETIRLKNFKVFQDAELCEIPSFCVVVGANGSGKSTLFDVFHFL